MVIFCGGRIPHILRPLQKRGGKDYYTLLGGACYHGVLDGEIVAQVEEARFLFGVRLGSLTNKCFYPLRSCPQRIMIKTPRWFAHNALNFLITCPYTYI